MIRFEESMSACHSHFADPFNRLMDVHWGRFEVSPLASDPDGLSISLSLDAFESHPPCSKPALLTHRLRRRPHCHSGRARGVRDDPRAHGPTVLLSHQDTESALKHGPPVPVLRLGHS
jgi:hypothetical protein